METRDCLSYGGKIGEAVMRDVLDSVRDVEEPTVIAGDVHKPIDGVRVCERDLGQLCDELQHLRAQVTDLQALNSRLHNQRIAANNERLAAEERATSLRMRVDELNAALADWRKRAEAERERADAAMRDADFLREQLDDVRRIIGAADGESVTQAAERVMLDRDAAERLAHEAEAQREAAVRERDEAKASLVRQSALIHRLQEADPSTFAAAVYAAGNDAIDAIAAPLNLDAVDRWAARIDIPARRIGSHSLPLPAYAKAGDAGLDLCTPVDVTIDSYERKRVRCGFAFAIPDGYEGQVRPKSGLSESKIDVKLGTIDSGFRGEVEVVVENVSGRKRIFEAGHKVAQLVIAPVARATLREVNALDETARGAGGFGSTGK